MRRRIVAAILVAVLPLCALAGPSDYVFLPNVAWLVGTTHNAPSQNLRAQVEYEY